MVSDKPEQISSHRASSNTEPLVDLSTRHDIGCGRSADTRANAALPGLDLSCAKSGDAPPAETVLLQSLNGKFDEILKSMQAKGHHWDTLPWLQNLSEDRKCYSQANEMGQELRKWIEKTPGLKGNFKVEEGTINEGKGADPRDFYTGNAEHNFIVLTNLKDGTKYYGDPWAGHRFSKDPKLSVHNFKGQQIWEHGF